MYHSITIGSKNTYDDWHLVPDSRPVISMPDPKTITVDIPGRNGILDLSTAIRKFPVFKNRTGSWKFHVLNDYQAWYIIYEQIANYIHGRYFKIILEDDPGWYYKGCLTVKNWTSNNNGTWSDIEIGYDLDPFKYSISTTLDDAWKWDPFSFVDGRITGTRFKDISVSSTSWTKLSFASYVGMAPITPIFHVVSPNGIDINVFNDELGINITHTGVTTGSYEWPEIILTEYKENNDVYVRYKKSGSNNNSDRFSIEYRMGSL